jgi:hypothetical protein
MSTRVSRAAEDGRGAPFHVSWGALFAGAAAALGVWILLYALGVALGLSTVDPQDSGTLRASGMFTGLWGLAAPLVALFIGGLVAGRSAGALGRGGGALHGLVVWSLTALGGLFLVATLFGNVLGSAVAVGQNVATRAMAEPGTAPGSGVVKDVQKAIGKVQAQATRNVERKAIEAAPETGTAFWVLFGALLLGMLAAVAGGAAGVTRGQRRLAEAEVIAGTEVVDSAVGRTTIPGVVPMADAEVDTLRAEIAELRGEIRELIQQQGAPIHH